MAQEKLYKEYKDQFDILNITPGAVITENTGCLSNTLFNVKSQTFVNQIIKMMGNVQGHSCGYWGHGLSNYLINLMPILKDGMLKKVGETISADFMKKVSAATNAGGISGDSVDKYKIVEEKIEKKT